MGPRAGLDGRKISSPPGFDPGPSSPGSSVAIPTDLPGPRLKEVALQNSHRMFRQSLPPDTWKSSWVKLSPKMSAVQIVTHPCLSAMLHVPTLIKRNYT